MILQVLGKSGFSGSQKMAKGFAQRSSSMVAYFGKKDIKFEIWLREVNENLDIQNYDHSLGGYRAFRSMLGKYRFAAIHSHNSIGNALVRIVSIGLEESIYLHIHGWAFYPRQNIFKKYVIVGLEVMLAFIKPATFIFCGEDLFNRSSRYWWVKKRKLLINGVSTGCLTSSKKKTIDVLFVGRVTYQKNIERVMRIAERNPRLSFVLAGGRLETFPHNVKNIGWLEDVTELFLSARVVINLSRYEGLPLVVLEALSHGLPVVLSDIDGHRELAKSTKAAFILKSDDNFRSLYEGIINNYSSLSEDAYLVAKRKYNFIKNIESFSYDS